MCVNESGWLKMCGVFWRGISKGRSQSVIVTSSGAGWRNGIPYVCERKKREKEKKKGSKKSRHHPALIGVMGLEVFARKKNRGEETASARGAEQMQFCVCVCLCVCVCVCVCSCVCAWVWRGGGGGGAGV